jgi:hypothetical protein
MSAPETVEAVALTQSERYRIFRAMRDVDDLATAVGCIVSERIAFSQQTTTNVMDALAESGGETYAAEAERDRYAAAWQSARRRRDELAAKVAAVEDLYANWKSDNLHDGWLKASIREALDGNR